MLKIFFNGRLAEWSFRLGCGNSTLRSQRSDCAAGDGGKQLLLALNRFPLVGKSKGENKVAFFCANVLGAFAYATEFQEPVLNVTDIQLK